MAEAINVFDLGRAETDWERGVAARTLRSAADKIESCIEYGGEITALDDPQRYLTADEWLRSLADDIESGERDA